MVLVVSAGLLLVACLASIAFGNKTIALGDIVDVLTGEGDPYLELVIDSRIERTLLAIGVGAALAVAGALMQGVTMNPLAEPGLLGVNSGAAAAMVTASAWFGISTGTTASVVVALVGAVVAVVVVYVIGTAGSTGASVVRLVLAGAVVSAILTAYVQAVALQMPRHFDNYRFWVVGSLSNGRLEQLTVVLPFIVVGLLLAFAFSSGLNALALGRETATALGVNTAWVRAGALGAATLTSAAATAAVGPIAFLGLAVPHIVRALVGLEMRRQVLGCLLLGPVVLLVADIAGRPQELMVGVMTAFIGGPALLLAVRRMGSPA